MRPTKKARLQKKEDKLQDKGESAFFSGKEGKARRNLKKALKIGNKLRDTNVQPSMSDKEFRQRNRKEYGYGGKVVAYGKGGAMRYENGGPVKNESMQNAAERLIADIALDRTGRNIFRSDMGEEPTDRLKFLLEGMSTGRELSSTGRRVDDSGTFQTASDDVSNIIRAYGPPSYHREVGMTPKTVESINRGLSTRIDPDLGVKMNYPYMSQERQRLDDVRADEVKKILSELVRNPPRRTVGEGYQDGGTIKYRSGGKMKYKKGGFPDLTGDGKVTMADILKGRGVGK